MTSKPFIEIDLNTRRIYLPCPEDAVVIERMVYDHIRATHHFLTDDNHDGYRVDQVGDDTFGLSIIRNHNSPEPAFAPWWSLPARPGQAWFSVYYCLVGPQTLVERASVQSAYATRYLEEAERCSDTIRGRRDAKKKRSFARLFDTTAKWLLKQSEMLERAITDPSVLPVDSNIRINQEEVAVS